MKAKLSLYEGRERRGGTGAIKLKKKETDFEDFDITMPD